VKGLKRKKRQRYKGLCTVVVSMIAAALVIMAGCWMWVLWEKGNSIDPGDAAHLTADTKTETKYLQANADAVKTEAAAETETESPAAVKEGTETESTAAVKEETETESTAAAKAPADSEADELIVLTEENRSDFVKVTSCKIQPGTQTLVFGGSVPEIPASDDNFFYLLEMKMYESEPAADALHVAVTRKGEEFSLTTQVHENSASSRLLSKFVAAVKVDGAYVPLCEPKYITNPEALASYTAPFPASASIKGLLVDPHKVRGSQLNDLGVKHAAYNLLVSNILGDSSSGNYPTIHYTYNGVTYKFDGQRIAEYDIVFSELTKRGITITGIILNNYDGTQPQLIHPLSRGGLGNYYAFNTDEEAGIQTMAAVGAFLAQRYCDSEHGVIMNWVIGNEVNVRESWNYMQMVDLHTYAREYADALRVFYNSIKSMNANARIYVSMDQQWDRNMKNNPNYDVKDMLLAVDKAIDAGGDIGWGVAHHPYGLPLTDTTFWELGPEYKHLVDDTENTSFVTMQNIEILTNFMQKPEMLTADGQVRPIILSELGYSSTKGEANQAAAFVYAYYKAEANPHIDALLLSRQTDAADEIRQDLAMGLTAPDGRKKYIYEVYKHIDGPNSAAVTEFAKPIIGITSWSQIGSGR